MSCPQTGLPQVPREEEEKEKAKEEEEEEEEEEDEEEEEERGGGLVRKVYTVPYACVRACLCVWGGKGGWMTCCP